ncbi:MAG: response regulator [Lentisphaerae bacterium]|nr:response regulator [Lentisphaerota bacterium]
MNKLILIVEDECDFRKVVRLRLEAQGYRVSEAANGKEGLQLARQLKPDLIILDVNMPGMNGFELTRVLSADPICCDIPIVMLTVRSQVGDKQAGAAAGADIYLVKPLVAGELLKSVSALIGS